MRRARAVLLALAAAPAGAAAPPFGSYEALLCVATPASSAPSCGAARVDVLSATRARVRVADIVYRLRLRPQQLDVATMHGRVQVDEFSAAYEWAGDTLHFVDGAKDVRYEVRFGARQR